MKQSEIAEVLDSVRSWPRDQQERAAELLISLEDANAEADIGFEDEHASGELRVGEWSLPSR